MASIREKLQDVYDLMHEFQGLSYINSSVVKTYTTINSDPLEVEGKMHVYVDPFKGGVTRTFKAKLKRMVADLPGVYITDFQSPRQLNGAPRKNESNIDFYSRNPYVVHFRYDESDKMPEADLDRVATKVASAWLGERKVISQDRTDLAMTAFKEDVLEEIGINTRSLSHTRGSGLVLKNQSKRDYEKIISKLKGHRDVQSIKDKTHDDDSGLRHFIEVKLTVWVGGRFDGREYYPVVEVSVDWVPEGEGPMSPASDVILFEMYI